MLMDTPDEQQPICAGGGVGERKIPRTCPSYRGRCCGINRDCARKYGAASTTNSSPKVPSTFAPVAHGA